ncbi:uncharacterized protein LOC129572999, partial [Sitodiplosis mosellana]|uniref:uncharacterized protein LOC129572999 n=1 Tax=Sitodiplosis mosellana TaxID=263140 RepID=UPI002444A08A
MASKQEAMGTGSNGQLNDKVAPEMASAEEKMETGTNGQPNDKVATAEEVMETSSNGQPNDKVGPEMASAEEVMETSSNGQLSDKVAPKVASVVGTDVLLSNKGVRKVIFYDGYKYRFDKVHNGTEYYFCDTARTKGCSQRLHKPIDNDDPRHFILKGSHIHSGDARKVNKKKVMTKLKDLSKNTKDTIRQVISKSIYDTSKATKAKLPTEKLMAQMVSRYRRGSGVLKNPQNLSELVLEGEYAQTVNKKPFLLHDSMAMVPPEEIEEGVRDRVLIFTTSENLKFLSLCDEYFMDGTFSVTPPLFSQLYTLHGRYKGWHVPLVYTLLTNKKQDTYVDVLKFLHELEPTLNPTDYMVDFEMAAMNAIGEVFPETE